MQRPTKNKIVQINTISINGEGSYSFTGTFHGYPVVFHQWDFGPIELDLDEFHETIGNAFHMLPQAFFDSILAISLPEIRKTLYYHNLVNSFSEN